MTDNEWFDLLTRFAELGGVAQNVCQREGEFGRGIFPIDYTTRARIMTPKNLLLDHDKLILHDNEIVVADNVSCSAAEKKFIELNYNYAWGNEGNRDSVSFSRFISSLSCSLKDDLLKNNFIDQDMLQECESDEAILSRFIDERAVDFNGKKVLAPVWDFVNHGSFSLPLRVTQHGVETPPQVKANAELLFKYSGGNSPMSMWKKYGFACNCIVAYSIPFQINLSDRSLYVNCLGQLGTAPNQKINFTTSENSISIVSLPVGCFSSGLPLASFRSILSNIGISAEAAKTLFIKVLDANIKVRTDIINSLKNPCLGAEAQLSRALKYEINLIEGSLIL